MASHDISNGSRTDPDTPAIPATIVADIDSNGSVTIYDEHRETAWISSTHAIALHHTM